ncbi:unnamed protein product [Closterium sp. Yama58-4]|nr:unnamed protein product [Closterium sp. Yama58-4]
MLSKHSCYGDTRFADWLVQSWRLRLSQLPSHTWLPHRRVTPRLGRAQAKPALSLGPDSAFQNHFSRLLICVGHSATFVAGVLRGVIGFIASPRTSARPRTPSPHLSHCPAAHGWLSRGRARRRMDSPMAAATGRQRSSAVKMVLAALFVAVCMFVLQSRDSTPVQFRVREAGVTHVLVTGGAGFIGSHASLHLLTSGHRVTIVDNLSRGNWGAVQVLQRIAPEGRLQFINADLGDPRKVEAVFASNAIDVVMHFAAVAYVGESMQEPLRYYHNVTGNTLALVEAMVRHGVTQLIYSSTCATYGEPKTMPITEDTVQAPINPYGKSKKMAEDIILDYARTNPRLAATILRYFNVIGSDPSGRLGEAPRPELRHHGRITGACFDAAMGKIDGLKVMGTDYPTADGTCIRDYIHVTDLVNAHVVAMHHLTPGTVSIYNVGTGKGYSVREFVNACLNVTGAPIKVMEQKARRPGDYAEVYSDPSKIYRELGWKAKYTDLRESLAMAWRWRRLHPDGY